MLPNRRPCETTEIMRNGERYHVSVGLHPVTGEVCEVFAYGPKVGSEAAWMLQDVCIAFSHSFQDGKDPADLVAGVIRDEQGKPASIYGEIIDLCSTYQ